VSIAQCYLFHSTDWILLLRKSWSSNCIPVWPWSIVQVKTLKPRIFSCFFLLTLRFLLGISTSFFVPLPQMFQVVSWRKIVGVRWRLEGEGCSKSSIWFQLLDKVYNPTIMFLEGLNSQAGLLLLNSLWSQKWTIKMTPSTCGIGYVVGPVSSLHQVWLCLNR
jgi:hypothetical protein